MSEIINTWQEDIYNQTSKITQNNPPRYKIGQSIKIIIQNTHHANEKILSNPCIELVKLLGKLVKEVLAMIPNPAKKRPLTDEIDPLLRLPSNKKEYGTYWKLGKRYKNTHTKANYHEKALQE